MALTEQNIFRSIYCETNKRRRGSYYTNLVKCCDCKEFPCGKLRKATVEELYESPLMQISGGKFQRRRARMYLFVNQDGTISEAYKGFDEKNPDWESLKDVKEVLYVNKVLVPQLKLVVKPKEEREEQSPEPKPQSKKGQKKNGK